MPNLNGSKEIMIRRSNDLIEARYRLSLDEQRLIFYISSSIHTDDEDFKDYEIRVADFVQVFGLENRKAIYKAVEESAKSLVSRRIELSRNGKRIYATWLSYAEYVEGSGMIKLRFDKSLKPYLLQLKENVFEKRIKGFTQYNLSTVINFKSSYSIRLYELLKMEVWKAEKVEKKKFEKTLTIAEYRDLLGIEKKAYPIFSAFRKWTIEPPVQEVSDQTELHIYETEYLKTGRKITSVCFHVQIRGETETKLRQDNLRIDDIQPEKEKDQSKEELKQKMVELGYGYEAARRDVNKYGMKRIERNIAYSLAKKQEGKVENFPAFLSQAITQDYGNNWEEAILDKKYRAEQKKEQEKLEEKRKEQQLAEEKKRSAKALKDFYAMPPEDRIELNEEFVDFLKHGTNHDLVLAVMFLDNTEKGEEVKDTLLKVKLATFLKSKGF